MSKFRPSAADVELFQEDMEANIQLVKTNTQYIEDHNQLEFVESLVAFYEKYDRLSEKQLWHMTRFWQEINYNKPDAGSRAVSGSQLALHQSTQRQVSNFQVTASGHKLVEMFDNAILTLQRPHITFWLPDEKLQFYRTTERNRYGAGNVVISNGRQYPETVNYGIIHRDGSFQKLYEGTPESTLQLLQKILNNPVEEFKINGKEFSHCCFCARELTDHRSISAGYGPICASNFGLPWGEENDNNDDLLNTI